MRLSECRSRQATSPYQQMHLPINRMILREGAYERISLDDQAAYYAEIFEALASGGRLLVCCKNGVHRSPCWGRGDGGG